jgi:hypothetical protein
MGQSWATDALLYRLLHPPSIQHFNEFSIFVMLKIDRKFGWVARSFSKSDAMQSCYVY